MLILVFIFGFIQGSENVSYRPVFCMHGISSGPGDCESLQKHVSDIRAGQDGWEPDMWIPIDAFNDIESFEGLWTQVRGITTWIQNEVAKNVTKFQHGYHFVCHSQGALLCRSVIEYWNDHNVHTLVALAAPNLGFWGLDAIHQHVPNLPGFLLNFTLENAHEVLENPLMQASFSVANLCHDPAHQQWHLEHNTFLPVFNNLVAHNQSIQFKKNFLSLKKAVFYTGNMTAQGTDFDGGIEPWNAGIFGFFDPARPTEILPVHKQPLWINDTFGLRSLDERGDLFIQAVANISHNEWVRDFNVFDKFTLPWLI